MRDLSETTTATTATTTMTTYTITLWRNAAIILTLLFTFRAIIPA